MAERQDWQDVTAVLQFRMAEQAIEAMNDPKNGVGFFEKNPDALLVLRDLVRAQTEDDTVTEKQATTWITTIRGKDGNSSGSSDTD